ncbi:hypothetical protein A2V61_02330 [Candidatus Woesebacteria bacterium RBG_19FT_COMBO_47_8]|nr:MAG: hypothetical protein A2V61_02330 [Candidatus Woesebacteria bacterium RBG_19FT_COMBO_47_8]
MKKIEIDEDIFRFLREHAEPLTDSPNSVLRRLLLGEKPVKGDEKREGSDLKFDRESQGSLGDFIDWVLRNKFTEQFNIYPPYRMIYESDSQIILFQNLNKGDSKNLWFHLRSKPLEVVRSSNKKAYVCLTIPADGYGYLIPLDEVDRHVSSAKWPHSYLEVNIDPSDNRWRDLKWKLDEYQVIMTEVDEQPQDNEEQKYSLDLLFKECYSIYDKNNNKESYFKSQKNLNYFLKEIVTFAYNIDIGPHTAVFAASLWIKKNHPDKYKKYSPYLDQLRKKEGFEIITLISTVK